MSRLTLGLVRVVQVAVLTLTARRAGSGLEYLVGGIGPILLLDRWLLSGRGPGRLNWRGPVNWRREIGLRGLWFLAGTVVILRLKPGAIAPGEAMTWSAALGSLAFLLEAWERLIVLRLPPGRGLRWPARLGVAAGIVVFSPVMAAHPPHTSPARTPADRGVLYEDVRFETRDGLRLAGWFVPAADPAAARGNVIFLHGLGGNRGRVLGHLPTFRRLRLNVLAFDFRGHGDSDGHTSTLGPREVEDLLAAVRWLERRCPDRPLVLMGVSMGAAVALQALPRLPQARGAWCEAPFGRLSRVIECHFTAGPPWVRRAWLTLYDVAVRLDTGVSLWDVNPAAAVARSRVPVMLCHGRGDELVPVTEHTDLAEAAGEWGTTWLTGATHYNMHQSSRAEYDCRLARHLGEWVGSPNVGQGVAGPVE